ncbi:MAG: glycosyltransferase family 4 protein, partial [Chloroflexaceae bacterium]|nr:glycosyltransferase family 4 protein [Chloroflexaceae bacterium]
RQRMLDGPPVDVRQKWLLQARGTFGPRTFQYYAFYSPALQALIDRALREERYDYIVVEQSQMAYFAARQAGAMHILDLHNIEYELLARRARVQRSPGRRLALTLEAIKFRRDEQRLYREFDLIFAPSARECATLRALPGMPTVAVAPNCIDVDHFALQTVEPAANEIVFVGSVHVDANRDAVNYFVQEVLPLIEAQVPDAHLSIVGGNPPPEIRAYGQRRNITVTGFVDDVREYMARARVMIAPFRSGGGTRLKILESMSSGLPVVATSIGAEGLDVVDGRDLLLADDSRAFAAAVVRLLRDGALRRQVIANGRRLVAERYSWQAVFQQVRSCLPEPPRRVTAPRAVVAGD